MPAALLTREPSLWFLVPFAVILLGRRDYADYGLSLSRHSWGSLRFHAVTVAAVFVPYVAGHYLLIRWWFGQPFALRLPSQLPRLVFDQLLGVGLPEEFFFRGYLQSQFNRTLGRPFAVLGARCGTGLLLAALLFALCHVPLGGLAQLSVFAPALLYGWLRERTDNVLVPSIYHALSNILLQTMLLSAGSGA